MHVLYGQKYFPCLLWPKDPLHSFHDLCQVLYGKFLIFYGYQTFTGLIQRRRFKDLLYDFLQVFLKWKAISRSSMIRNVSMAIIGVLWLEVVLQVFCGQKNFPHPLLLKHHFQLLSRQKTNYRSSIYEKAFTDL